MNYTKLIFNTLLLFPCLFQQTPIAAGELVINGPYSGDKEINLNAKILKGEGLFHAPTINITCDDFQFTGTIYCNGICKIQSKKEFDFNIFTRRGSGIFIINGETIDATPTPEDVSIDDIRETDDAVNINAHVFKGNGFLDANNIVIDCNRFEFTGTIRCNGTCTIKTVEEFEIDCFKRQGQGIFEIVTGLNGEYRSTYQTTYDHDNNPLSALFDSIGLTEKQKGRLFDWLNEDTLGESCADCCQPSEQADERADTIEKTDEEIQRILQEKIEEIIFGLQNIIKLPTEKLVPAQTKLTELAQKLIKEYAERNSSRTNNPQEPL